MPDDGQASPKLSAAGLIRIFTIMQTGKSTKTIDIGGDPRRIAFSQQGHIAAVTNTAGFITFIR